MTNYSVIKIKTQNQIAEDMRKRFPEIKHVTNNVLLTRLILDYLDDFSVFKTQYYTEKDIRQLFTDLI